jgi:acyl-CoA reductase-like NAD-dependent aldehyde dehydrogenase
MLNVTDTVLASRDFAGLHFTGSYLKIFGQNWNKHSPLQNIPNCWETGGKDFIIAHSSANPKQVATGCVVHLNFKVKNVQQLQDHLPKVYGQRLKNKLSLM